MDVLLAALLAGLEKFGPHVVTTGLFLWYLVRRDSRTAESPGDAPQDAAKKPPHRETNGIRQYQVDQAILEIARQTAAQTELLRQCVGGLGDNRVALGRIESRLDGRAKG